MSLTSVSFVIPMYNEAGGIENTVRRLVELARELTGDYEIVIADDCSSDGSGPLVDKMAEADPHLKVVHLKENAKFGGALKAGIKHADKEVIIYTDSDLPCDFSDVKKASLLLEGADIVTGCSSVKKGESLARIIMSKVYNFLIQVLFRTNIRDINSGLKIYRRKIFDGMNLISDSPFIDVEIFVRAMRKNCVIRQYPVIFKARGKGKSYIARPAVILKTAADMLKFRFRFGSG